MNSLRLISRLGLAYWEILFDLGGKGNPESVHGSGGVGLEDCLEDVGEVGLELGRCECNTAAVTPGALQFTQLRRFARQRVAMLGVGYLVVLLGLFVAAPWLPIPEATVISDDQFLGPSKDHWFGTDVHGRDLFARTIYGLRISLLVGVCGAVVSLTIGTLWGGVAAYLGGRWDGLMMRCVDVLYAMPSIIFVIVLMAVYDAVLASKVEAVVARVGAVEPTRSVAMGRLLILYVGLGAVSWLTVARIVRGEVLALRERTFVLASQVLGASVPRILRRHLLPNLTGVLTVYLTLTIPTIILYESFLSFLGLGIQPPSASLGSLIAEGAQQINPIRVYWWMVAFPAGALVTTLLALNFVGDGLRNLFNLRSSDQSR